MRYKVKLLTDYHGALWPHAKIGNEKVFEADKFQQFAADFGLGKVEVTPLEDAPAAEEEAKPESAIAKALGKLKK